MKNKKWVVPYLNNVTKVESSTIVIAPNKEIAINAAINKLVESGVSEGTIYQKEIVQIFG